MVMNTTSEAFRRKIASFCNLRLSPIFTPREVRQLTDYMFALVDHSQRPPRRGQKIDWSEVATACNLPMSLTAKQKRVGQFGFDAIGRWVEKGGGGPGTSHSSRNRPKGVSNSAYISSSGKSANDSLARVKLVPKPEPINQNPTPLFDVTEEPITFQAALTLQLRRFGETYHYLHRAIYLPGDNIDPKTISNWVQGIKVPRSVQSFDVLHRIEKRYGLPLGYFKNRLPHLSRSASGHVLEEGVTRGERRRMAWHLPDDFNKLPLEKRQEILEWVRRVIISGATDYRRFQATASKQRYAIRFPAMACGGSAGVNFNMCSDNGLRDYGDIEHPDLLSGVLDAPPRLSLEMSNLMTFKTATLTQIGFQRNGVWGEETAAQKQEHLGLMFGALAASPRGEVSGRGLPLRSLTFGLLVFPAVWDWYLQWRELRRGFFTAWEVDMLSIALAFTREETGWLRQHPELADRLVPMEGLISPQQVTLAKSDWNACCDIFYTHARTRIKEVQRVMRVHRDPFEPIMCVLEAPSPLREYRKITEEILLRMPDEHRYPRAVAESVRSFLLLRLGLHLGLRQKNLRQLLLCPRGQSPTSERRLEQMKRGEIRWSDRENGWEVFIPSNAFKNSNSSFFGAKPFRLVLPDLKDLYHYLNDYIERHRAILLSKAKDPGTLFVKTVKRTSIDASYNQTTFYEAWRLVIQRYGIFNPYTGRGAIKGLLPHGPHNVRDVLATHILKITGSYEQASYAIQDTPDMVLHHYGRFLPQDKAALAARILNEVWQVD